MKQNVLNCRLKRQPGIELGLGGETKALKVYTLSSKSGDRWKTLLKTERRLKMYMCGDITVTVWAVTSIKLPL